MEKKNIKLESFDYQGNLKKTVFLNSSTIPIVESLIAESPIVKTQKAIEFTDFILKHNKKIMVELHEEGIKAGLKKALGFMLEEEERDSQRVARMNGDGGAF